MSGQPELKEMTLLEHLRELRKRLMYVALFVVLGASVAYSYSEEVFQILTSVFYLNFKGGSLIGTGPAEAFMLKIKVAVFAGVILMSPAILFQIWKFIEPGMYPKEKKLALPFIVFTTGLFLLGVSFCYSVVLPFSLGFFADEYKSIGVTPSVRISEHLSVLMQALIGFGAAFELPVLAFFLGRLGIIDHRMMIRSSRYAIIIIFVVSAVLTPPDALTQLLMAGPLLLLYALSILVVKLTETRSSVPATLETPPSSPSKSVNSPSAER